MKNITVSVPDEVYRAARVHAAEHGRSVSALVSEFLTSLNEDDDEFQRLVRLQEKVMSEIENFSASDRLTRDEVHERAVR